MKIKNQKLEEFLREHKNLASQFEDCRNVESKYQIIKRTINILNPRSFKPPTSNSKIYRESDEYGSETEQGYFRLLNRMCEAQQKSKEQDPKMVNKKKQQSKMRRETNSMHESRKRYYWNRSKQQQNQSKKKKFIEIPNFAEMIKKCSIGYMGHSGQLAIQKHYKKVRSALANKIDENKETNIKGENAKLKKEVNRLKQKAKQLYQISFEQFDEEFKGNKNQNNNQDDQCMSDTKYSTYQIKQSHSLHEPLISGNMSTNIKQSGHDQIFFTESEDTRYGMELNQGENSKVPSFLLRNKARPLSVGTCVIKRPSKLHKKKLAYFKF